MHASFLSARAKDPNPWHPYPSQEGASGSHKCLEMAVGVCVCVCKVCTSWSSSSSSSTSWDNMLHNTLEKGGPSLGGQGTGTASALHQAHRSLLPSVLAPKSPALALHRHSRESWVPRISRRHPASHCQREPAFPCFFAPGTLACL